MTDEWKIFYRSAEKRQIRYIKIFTTFHIEDGVYKACFDTA